MRYEFKRRADGFVEVTLCEGLSLLQHALEDSLGTRPPRGAPQDGPSTYWLDDAMRRLRERLESGGLEPFASGNITYLQLRGDCVEARLDVDPVDSDIVDRVQAADFLKFLRHWRAVVLEASPAAAGRVPPPRTARPMPPPA